MNTKLYTKSRTIVRAESFRLDPALNTTGTLSAQVRFEKPMGLGDAVLSFFGFIHGMQLGMGASSLVTLGYFFLAGLCLTVVWSQGNSG